MPVAEIDFETYSEAGLIFDPASRHWHKVRPTAKTSIGAVGAAVYSEHRTTEVLCMAYDLHEGLGARLWLPKTPVPVDLCNYIVAGELVEAWNSLFEYFIWRNVCRVRMGWPALPLSQTRDAMARARMYGYPGALANAAKVSHAPAQKMSEGKRLIDKFCVPRNLTKTDDRIRVRPEHDPDDAQLFYRYCVGDIQTERSVADRTPELSPFELSVWQTDQRINVRGVPVDMEAVEACADIVAQAERVYLTELQRITRGQIYSPGQSKAIRDWLAGYDVHTESVDADHVEELLERDDLHADVRRVLEIKSTLGSASVKKLEAFRHMTCRDGRARGAFTYAGANTARWTSGGLQFHNFPKSGPKVKQCQACKRHSSATRDDCGWCGSVQLKKVEWSHAAVVDALHIIMTSRDLASVEYIFGDAVATVSGCLRGLIRATPGYEFVCSDYSAIEAVVLAMISGEQWRIDVFRTHGKIYEASASRITGVPLEEFLRHKQETGEHHPLRNKIGKYAELASGYQGWTGAWAQFGADKHLTEDEIEAHVKMWREQSPKIVAFWRGVENAAMSAVRYPGTAFEYNGFVYQVQRDILFCRLLSGRWLVYHEPRVIARVREFTDRKTGKVSRRVRDALTYRGWNTNAKRGRTHAWIRIDAYGGSLTENICQATSRDILAHGMVNAEPKGYPIVMHVHDEMTAEVLIGTQTVEGLEAVMNDLPDWCADWPVRASGGWVGDRYRKD